MEIRIRTLGGLQVRVDGLELTRLARAPTRAALLVFLAVEGEVTRDLVQGTLWSRLPPDRARHALNQALYLLRKELGDNWIESRGEQLRTTEVVYIDAAAFEAAVVDGPANRGLSLYGGDFLEGWHLRNTPEFEKWTDLVRCRLSRLHRDLCRSRLADLRADGRTPEALELARHWVRLDPLEDEAHHALLELLAETGRRAEALERYEALERTLASDGLTPLAETLSLVVRIRDGPELSEPGGHESRGGQPHLDNTVRPPASVSRRDRRVPTPSLVLVAIAVVFAVLLVRARAMGPNASPALAPDRVLVYPLSNRTGDPSLDPVGWMAADWITQGLARAEFLEVLPSGELPRAPASDSDGPPTDPVRTARSAAEDLGAGLLVTGAYYSRDDGLEFDVQVLEGPEWAVLTTVGPVRTASRDPMEVVEILRQRVAIGVAMHRDERLGGAFATSQTPPSYESYLAFAEGFRTVARGDWSGAVGPLTRANELSPEFTAPLILAGAAFLMHGEYQAADSVLRVVEASRDRLPRYDRLRLELVRSTLEGDNVRGFIAAKEAARLVPGGTAHWGAAQRALELNRPGEALELLSTWDPTRAPARNWPLYWDVVTQAHHLRGDHERELEEAIRARNQLPDRIEAFGFELRALAALGRAREVGRVLDEALTRAVTRELPAGRLLVSTAEELHAHGDPESALRVLARFQTWLEGLPPELQDRRDVRLLVGRVRSDVGRLDEARDIFARLHREAPDDPEALRFLGTLAAQAGDREAAEARLRALADLEPRYLFGRQTLGRAAITARLGRREQAVALLRQAVEQGLTFRTVLHADPDLSSLRGFPPFEAFLRPDG